MPAPIAPRFRAAVYALGFLATVSVAADNGVAKQDSAMHHLFQALDIDGDGQIRSTEAINYFRRHWKGGGDEDGGVASAGEAFIDAIDTADEGDTVSEAELQRALSSRLQVRFISHSTGQHSAQAPAPITCAAACLGPHDTAKLRSSRHAPAARSPCVRSCTGFPGLPCSVH